MVATAQAIPLSRLNTEMPRKVMAYGTVGRTVGAFEAMQHPRQGRPDAQFLLAKAVP
jgi:hypothetical protein